MKFNEELLTDDRFQQLNTNRQSELITQHCATIEEQIRTAPSRLEALRRAAFSCNTFEQSCPSALVRNALERHVENLILHYWNNNRS